MARYLIIALALIALLPLTQGQQRGTVRLVRNGLTSSSYSSGRVQIYISSWGHICDDTQFAFTEATVLCHQLGYTGASTYSRASSDISTFGLDSFPILVDDVDCSTSSYLVILQCSHSLIRDSNCIHGSDDVSVTCYTTRIWSSPYDGQIRLQDALYTSLGLVEVYCNGQWGTVCDDLFDSIDANTVCRQLGYTGAARYDHLLYRGSSSQRIWLDNIFCASSSYNCLRSCQRCPSIENHNCGHSEDVTIECVYSSTSSASTTTSTCNFGTSTNTLPTTITTFPTRITVTFPAVTFSTGVNVGGIVAGAIIGVIILTVLPIVIPICICICLGVGVGAACRDSNRPRTTRVVATAAPPQPTATVITTNTSTLQKTEYPTQPVAYPANPAQPPPPYSDKSPYPEAGGYAPPYPDPAYPPPGSAYPPPGAAYPPPGAAYPPPGAYPPPQ